MASASTPLRSLPIDDEPYHDGNGDVDLQTLLDEGIAEGDRGETVDGPAAMARILADIRAMELKALGR